MRFSGKVAYVTGGGHGIGRAIALRMAGEGAAVAVSDLDQGAAVAVGDEIARAAGNAMALTADVTDADSVDASLSSTVARFARLDILINTAGGEWAEPERFEDITDDTWLRKVDVNLIGVGRCIRAALPHLIAWSGQQRCLNWFGERERCDQRLSLLCGQGWTGSSPRASPSNMEDVAFAST